MKIDSKKTGFFFLLTFLLAIPAARAEDESEMTLTIVPEPLYRQINSGESYLFNISITSGESSSGNSNVSNLESIIVALKIGWWVKGSYRFGDALRSYVSGLDEIEYNQTISYPALGERAVLVFNHTFSRDYLDLGIHPYETLEIRLEAAYYKEVYNETLGDIVKGDELGTISREVFLLDDDKIDYVEGKLEDLEVELGLLDELPSSETSMEEEEYLVFLEDMRSYVEMGNYINALDTFHEFDDKEREELMPELILDLNNSLSEASRVPQLESRIDRLERNIENLQSQLIQLQEQYHDKQEQYERQKSLTTTAFTGIWVIGIAAFLVGALSHRIFGEG